MSSNVKVSNVVPAMPPATAVPVAPAEAALNTTKSVGKSAVSGVKDAFKKGKDGFMKLMADKGPLMIFLIVVILVFIIVIIYISFALKNANLSSKVLIKRPIKLDEVSTAVQIPGSDIPKPAVGREYTYSFWIYVDNFNQTANNNKLLFYRGAKDNINAANPVVMMDSVENRLYFAIKTENASLNIGTDSDLRKIVNLNYFKNKSLSSASSNKYIIMEVDYVPVQRWVNIVCIVDNKILTLFMDGEIYSVKTIDELKALRNPPELDTNGQPINYNLIIDKTEGDVFIGKNIVNNNITLNGYLSKIEFMNYAINLNQVKNIYNKGPLSRSMGQSSATVYTGVGNTGSCPAPN